MTELKCSVRSCSFQKDDCCCRGNITVEGAHANRNSETSCGSFEEKKNCGCANSTGKPPKMSDVTCEAVNCKFNEGRKCHAKDFKRFSIISFSMEMLLLYCTSFSHSTSPFPSAFA